MNKKQRQLCPVLVVDDEPSLCQFLKRILLQIGFARVDIANSGSLAYDKLEAGSYGLVFLDINLPEINGLNLLEDIKHISPKSVVVMCSGHSDPDNVIGSRLIGARGFLEKPFSVEDVISFLGNHRL